LASREKFANVFSGCGQLALHVQSGAGDPQLVRKFGKTNLLRDQRSFVIVAQLIDTLDFATGFRQLLVAVLELGRQLNTLIDCPSSLIGLLVFLPKALSSFVSDSQLGAEILDLALLCFQRLFQLSQIST